MSIARSSTCIAPVSARMDLSISIATIAPDLWSDVYREVRKTIERLDDSRLVGVYESWTKAQEIRETEMLKNIGDYCKEKHLR